MNSWMDVHAHIDRLEVSSEEAVRLAQSSGVERIVTVAADPGDIAVVRVLAKQFHPIVWCALGIHPHEAKFYNDSIESDIESGIAQDSNCIALGEIGLDYYYNHSEREVQKDVFRRQMSLAAKLKIPVQIHTRDAEDDTIMILREFQNKVTGIIHCFTGTENLAHAALGLGYNISFSGVLTFQNAKELRKIAEWVPSDRLHVETDSPYLAPVPHRGKKNMPAFVTHTAQVLAQIRQCSPEELSLQLKENAKTVFPRLKW